MKRSELKVGDHLYHAKPGAWRYDYDSRDAHVVVQSVEPHTRGSFGRREPLRTNSGAGVLVKVVDPRAPETGWTTTVVQLGNLRGPYEATAAEVEARRQQSVKEREQVRAQREAAQAKAQKRVQRMHAAGLPSAYASTGDTVKVRAEEVLALLDKVERLAREIEDLQQQLRDTRTDLNATHARPAIVEE